MQLRHILLQRRVAGKSSLGHKRLILGHLKRLRSFEYTAAILDDLRNELEGEIERVENVCRTANPPLRLLLIILQVQAKRQLS